MDTETDLSEDEYEREPTPTKNEYAAFCFVEIIKLISSALSTDSSIYFNIFQQW